MNKQNHEIRKIILLLVFLISFIVIIYRVLQFTKDYHIISDKYGGAESPKLLETISRWINQRGISIEGLLHNPIFF